MGMNELDINLLPWHARRQQRWKWQRKGFYMCLIMLVGWCGCGHLWHGMWRCHYAEQALSHLQAVQAQTSFLAAQQAQWLSAEQWRQRAWTHQHQRLQDNHQLAGLWQSLRQANITVQSIHWQPHHLQLAVMNPRQTDLEQVLHITSLYPHCHAQSDTAIECRQGEDSREAHP